MIPSLIALRHSFLSMCMFAACMSGRLAAQEPVPAPRDSTLVDSIVAGESSSHAPKRRLVKWNELDGRFTTLRVGAGFLVDAGGFSQDAASKEQFDLEPGTQVRDSRLLLNGRIKSKRSITWCAGFMYDGVSKEWFVRMTGVMVAIPELHGHLWLGRAKEGISLNMVMSGYAGWTMERSTMVTAAVPLLADGLKWLGQVPGGKILYNLGWYTDVFSEGQSFSSYDQQFVGRVVWLPIKEDKGTLLHIGLAGRYGLINDRTLKLRARPEMNLAPYFLDTGPFATRDSRMAQGEVYYRPGPVMIGAEYFVQQVNALDVADPLFHGGDVALSWLITGETRTYNSSGGYFLLVSPERPVLKGGPGAWEAVLRLSYIDLDDGAISGGMFWRFTPMVNWYLTDHLRLELSYGVGQLDRFGLVGTTQFLQSRFQFQF